MKTPLILGGFVIALGAAVVGGLIFAGAGTPDGTAENIFHNIVFLGAAMGAVIGGTLAVTRNNPVYAILSLLGVFVCMSIMFFLLAADLLAVLQLTVYAGAVLMLFLFVIMLFNLGSADPAAEEGGHEKRETATEAERHATGFSLNTPRIRGLIGATLLGVLLIIPILKLEGEQWEQFLPNTGETIQTPEEFRSLVPFATMPAVEIVPEAYRDRLIFVAERNRLMWRGPMDNTIRVTLREAPVGTELAPEWQRAIDRLYATARWAELEHKGLNAQEKREIEASRISALRDMGMNEPQAKQAIGHTGGVRPPGFGSVPRVGQDLFVDYVIAFEFIAVLILVGCVGTIVLAKKRLKELEDTPETMAEEKARGVDLFHRHRLTAQPKSDGSEEPKT